MKLNITNIANSAGNGNEEPRTRLVANNHGGENYEGAEPAPKRLNVTGGLQGEILPSEVRTPILNVAQSVGPLAENFRPGNIVLDKTCLLSPGANPVEVTLLACRKYYQEKVPYGSETRPRVCETEAEVTALGGRLQWEDGESANFEPVLQITALIRCPEGVDGPFPYTYEGADYAVCRWYLRGTGFKAAGRTILTHAAQLAKTQRPLHEARFELTTKREKLWNGNAVSVPQLRMAGKHDDGFCSFAESLIG